MEVLLPVAFSVIAAVVDAHRFRVPDWITLPGIATACALSLFGLGPSALAVVASAIVAAATFGSARLLSGGKLGWGDVKLSAMIAAFLGYRLWVLSMLWALAGAALFFVVCRLHQGSVPERAPFAPFLALGTVTSVIPYLYPLWYN